MEGPSIWSCIHRVYHCKGSLTSLQICPLVLVSSSLFISERRLCLRNNSTTQFPLQTWHKENIMNFAFVGNVQCIVHITQLFSHFVRDMDTWVESCSYLAALELSAFKDDDAQNPCPLVKSVVQNDVDLFVATFKLSLRLLTCYSYSAFLEECSLWPGPMTFRFWITLCLGGGPSYP